MRGQEADSDQLDIVDERKVVSAQAQRVQFGVGTRRVELLRARAGQGRARLTLPLAIREGYPPGANGETSGSASNPPSGPEGRVVLRRGEEEVEESENRGLL